VRRRAAPLVLALLFGFAPGLAFAQGGTDAAAAQALFYDARALMQAGKYSEACPKLEESLRLDAGVGTQFNLADCEEHLGKLAAAWAAFLEVAAESKSSGQHDREKLARKRAAALEPRLPRLVIVVSEGPPGLEVKRDGVPTHAAAWGTAIPVDPGLHRVTASAPGKQTWETTIMASEARTARVNVPRELPASAVAIAPPSAAGARATDASAAATSPPSAVPGADALPPSGARRGTAQRTVGWIVTGLGAAGLGVGAGFGLTSLGDRNDSRAHCAGNVCDPAGVSLRDDALRNGTIATVVSVAGGAALVGGALLVLTAPRGARPSEPDDTLRLAPTVAFGGLGFTLRGAFQ
jgi:serine/threonine-protein kinase